MEKNIVIPLTNVSEGVEFFLRGAKKRRTMAVASIREINSDIVVKAKQVSAL